MEWLSKLLCRWLLSLLVASKSAEIEKDGGSFICADLAYTISYSDQDGSVITFTQYDWEGDL